MVIDIDFVQLLGVPAMDGEVNHMIRSHPQQEGQEGSSLWTFLCCRRHLSFISHYVLSFQSYIRRERIETTVANISTWLYRPVANVFQRSLELVVKFDGQFCVCVCACVEV